MRQTASWTISATRTVGHRVRRELVPIPNEARDAEQSATPGCGRRLKTKPPTPVEN